MEFSTISFFPHLRLLNGVKFIVPDMYRGDLAVHRLLMDCLITEQCVKYTEWEWYIDFSDRNKFVRLDGYSTIVFRGSE